MNENNGDLSPGDIILAMKTHGWGMSGDEQDAHELYHILCDTLDEEIIKPKKEPSLIDVLSETPEKTENLVS